MYHHPFIFFLIPDSSSSSHQESESESGSRMSLRRRRRKQGLSIRAGIMHMYYWGEHIMNEVWGECLTVLVTVTVLG